MPLGIWGLSPIWRQAAVRGLLFLLFGVPGTCLAAYDPPQIHITPQDVQAVIQCYLDASGRGAPVNATSACDKRAAAINEMKRRRGALEESPPTGRAIPEWQKVVSGRPAFGATLLLTLLTLLCSVIYLRRAGKGRYEADRMYDVAGNSPCP